MVVNRREQTLKKGWFEEWLDITFMEKLVTIAWCGLPYLIWLMVDGLSILYKIPITIGVWVLLTLLCYGFGKFMSSEERYWN